MIGLIEEVVIARGTNANDKIRLNAIFYTYINLPTFFLSRQELPVWTRERDRTKPGLAAGHRK